METTLCHIIDGDRVLLKRATRGVSKGKWNALGGRIDVGESPEQCAVREVREESGLMVRGMKRRGTLYFYKGSKKNLFVKMHLFSATRFSGRLTESDEGELKWFGINSIPYANMWDDDPFWFPLLLNGISFKGEFIFDNKMDKVLSYSISEIRR